MNPLFLFFICFLLVFLGIYNEWKEAVAGAYISTSVMLLCSAEILSLSNSFHVIGCVLFFAIAITGIFLLFKDRIAEGMDYGRRILETLKKCRKKRLVLFAAVAAFSLITITKALSWPPQNGDSMTYHLPRSYMYWKNESIHNFPFSYKWGLYTGPFSAIVMAYLRIFSHGSDYLLNLIQFPGWITACIMTGSSGKLICRHFGEQDSKILFIVEISASILVLTLPIAVFQSSSTQCDLMGGAMQGLLLILCLKFLLMIANIKLMGFWQESLLVYPY